MRNDVHAYATYKPCSISLIGEVPAHWEVKRLAQIGTFSKGGGGTKDDEVDHGLPCVRYGDIYTSHKYFVTHSRSRINPDRTPEYARMKYGDALFAGSGETIEDIGKSVVNLIEGEAYCGGDVILFHPTVQAQPRFMGYALDSPPAAFQKSSMGRGITIMHVYSSQLKNMCIPFPPLEEQAAIVRYLDHADDCINRYISAKRRLITLLEEQRQAVIHQAVTNGLDPNVPSKQSGIGWLADVPQYWQLPQLKQVAKILRGKFSHRPRNDPALYGGTYPFIQTGDVAAANRIIKDHRQTLNERGLAVSTLFPAGTLVMTIAANIGDVAILDFEACFPDSIVGFVPTEKVERDFLYYIFCAMKSEFLSEAPVNTQGNLNIERIGSRKIPLPSLAEQNSIVCHLAKATAHIDKAADLALRQVSLIDEYRTRLIADVVTGQLDVRTTTVELPAEAR